MKRVMLVAAVALLLGGCGSDDDSAPPSPTTGPDVSATPTGSATPSATETRTVTQTRTITQTPTITPTLGVGANIGYFGILRADNTAIDPSGTDSEGRPIFDRPNGSGFVIVVEARRGTNNRNPGELAFNPDGAPDLQIEASRPLGNGSTAICDNMEPNFGGVVSVNPPDFEDTQAVIDALNDFGCRFTNGSGEPIGRLRNDGCILFPDGEYGFMNENDIIQFCATVTLPMRFLDGPTVLTARVIDTGGTAGPEREIVVHVLE